MAENDVILQRIVLLEEYIRDLEEIKNNKGLDEFICDKFIRRYVERTLHIAVESCLDIANHIISYQGFREPINSKDCFQVLMEEGIIAKDLTDSLKKMAQFRNVIVHDYIRIQPEIVYAVLQKNLGDIILFAKTIKTKYIDTRS